MPVFKRGDWQGCSGPEGWRTFYRPIMRVQVQNHTKKLIFKISKSEFGLIKLLLYYFKSHNFCGIILLPKRSSWF